MHPRDEAIGFRRHCQWTDQAASSIDLTFLFLSPHITACSHLLYHYGTLFNQQLYVLLKSTNQAFSQALKRNPRRDPRIQSCLADQRMYVDASAADNSGG